MSDLYTCRVCGLSIILDNLTEHVLLHEEYSAFTYNETTRIIEPLLHDEDDREESQQPDNVSADTSQMVNNDYTTGATYPVSSLYEAAHLNYSTIPTDNVTPDNTTVLHPGSSSLQNVNFSEQKYSTTHTNATFVIPERGQYTNEHTGTICLDSVQNLTGIRMIANAAESLSKKAEENDILDYTEIEDIGQPANNIPVQKPLNPGDIIDTICLPYLGNLGTERLFCECSIVFNRFITDPQQAVNEPVQPIPEFRNFYTHTYNENTGMSLEDIIEDDTDSDCNYEQYNNNTPGRLSESPDIVIDPIKPSGVLCLGLRRSGQKNPIKVKPSAVLNLGDRRNGQKMEVYKYKEPLVKCDLQKELPKNIIPELLKNPAVVKYLETMTGETIIQTDKHLSKSKIQNQELSKTKDVTEISISSPNDDAVIGGTVMGSQIKQFIPINENTSAVKSKVKVGTMEHPEERGRTANQSNRKLESSTSDYKTSSKCVTRVILNELLKKVDSPPRLMKVIGDSENSLLQSNTDSEQIQRTDKNTDDLTIIHVEHDSENQLTVYQTEPEKDGKVMSDRLDIEVGDTGPATDEHTSDVHRPTEHAESHDSEHEDVELVNTDGDFACLACHETFDCEDKLIEHGLAENLCKKSKIDSLESKQNEIQIPSIQDDIKVNEMPSIQDNIKVNLENSICEEVETLDDGLFYCIICDIILPAKADLQQHMLEHKVYTASNENNLKLDGTCASDDDTLTADSDPEYVSEAADAVDEMDDIQQERDDLQHGLIIEKKTRRSRRTRKRKSNPTWLKENVCGKRKRKEKETVLPRKEFVCDNCGAGFNFVTDCLRHSSLCRVQKNVLKCFQGCGMIFKTRSELDYHKNFCSRRIAYQDRVNGIVEKIKHTVGEFTDADVDDNLKLVVCKHCENVVTFQNLPDHKLHCQKEILSAGIKIENFTEEENPIQCQYCNKSCLSADKMKLHELVCKLRPFQNCDYCEFSCKGNKPMSLHLANKHNVNPYKCDMCSKTFKLKGSLNYHVRSHHMKETYTCEFCGKSFLKQSIYRSHVSIQHEGFRYRCTYCDKAFKDKRTWMTHEKSHKGAYDYACTVCKKTFNKSSKYKDHMKDLHSIDGEAALALNSKARELREQMCANICDVCGEKFPLVEAYDHHMMKEHGV